LNRKFKNNRIPWAIKSTVQAVALEGTMAHPENSLLAYSDALRVNQDDLILSTIVTRYEVW